MYKGQYVGTGAIATAAAACIPGTLVHEAARPADRRPDPRVVRIANPYGVMDARVDAEPEPASGNGPEPRLPRIRGIAVGRTARHILDGQVWVPRRLLETAAERELVAAPMAGTGR